MFMSQLENFIDVFKRIDKDHIALVESIYSEDVTFVDPAHTIQGVTDLRRYFAALYENVSQIRFEFHRHVKVNGHAFLEWTMTFQHERLNGNRPVSVAGCSSLVFDSEGRVSSHRDYFDLGAMLYEQLPLLGTIVKRVKRKLGS